MKNRFLKIIMPALLAVMLVGLYGLQVETKAVAQSSTSLPDASIAAKSTGSGTAVSANSQLGSGMSKEQLAKMAQNPIANMISVPFQNNFNFGVGPNNVCQYVLDFQPVIPFELNDDWNLITRTIVPIINLPSPAPGAPSASGLGDVNPTLFLSPAKPGKLIWGLGPTITFPTATDSMLGDGKVQMGPSAVALVMPGHWVLGALANNQWSVAGWGQKNQNNLMLQYFINYNLPDGWYLTSSPIITADWNAASDDRWTVPVGGGFGKIVKLGKLPVNLQLSAFDNICKPNNGPDWQLRFQVQLLLPKTIFGKQ